MPTDRPGPPLGFGRCNGDKAWYRERGMKRDGAGEGRERGGGVGLLQCLTPVHYT